MSQPAFAATARNSRSWFWVVWLPVKTRTYNAARFMGLASIFTAILAKTGGLPSRARCSTMTIRAANAARRSCSASAPWAGGGSSAGAARLFHRLGSRLFVRHDWLATSERGRRSTRSATAPAGSAPRKSPANLPAGIFYAAPCRPVVTRSCEALTLPFSLRAAEPDHCVDQSEDWFSNPKGFASKRPSGSSRCPNARLSRNPGLLLLEQFDQCLFVPIHELRRIEICRHLVQDHLGDF
jgi:hypothetical protein